MKLIDKTPLQDDKGNISFVARVQGTLKYGLNWSAELEAQKTVIAQLDRQLEKGFILIRNFTLPNSEIVIPLVLVGLGGIWVIYVTNVKGHFEAKGDQWNTLDNGGKSQPAGINLISRVSQLTSVFQKYLKIKRIDVPGPVEPILITADPGAHVTSMRPAARVVMSDAIKQFAASIAQARPIWSPEYIHLLADRIIDPAPPSDDVPIPAAPPPVAQSPEREFFGTPSQEFNANDLGFSFEENPVEPVQQEKAAQPGLRETSPARPLPSRAPAAPKKMLGMSNGQIMVLAGMFLFWCCIVTGFGAFIYLTQ